MSYTIRAARPEDAASLLEIYAPYVTDTAVTLNTTSLPCRNFPGVSRRR